MNYNECNNYGQSAIFIAITKHYNDKICKYYIEKCNININKIDNENHGLIDIAVEYLNIKQYYIVVLKSPI